MKDGVVRVFDNLLRVKDFEYAKLKNCEDGWHIIIKTNGQRHHFHSSDDKKSSDDVGDPAVYQKEFDALQERLEEIFDLD